MFLSMRFSVLFQLGVFLMMVPLSIPLASLFSQEQSVKDLLWHYLLVVPFSYGFQGIVMMLISGLNALHQPLKAFQWSSMRLFAFTLPSAWVGSQLYDIEGLFIGIALGNIIGGILGYLYALKLRETYLAEQANG
jgi:Na+-driven multidrug efflux pump